MHHSNLLAIAAFVFLFAATGCESADPSDAGLRADAGPGGRADGGAGVDGGRDGGGLDAGGPRASIDEWLRAISAMEAQYCRCGFELMDYATAARCAAAHSVNDQPRSCAVSVYAPFEADLGASTLCTTRVLAEFAACMGAVSDCDADALNVCERARSEAGSMCPAVPADRLDELFHEIGVCSAGDAGACPLAELTAVGASVWSGDTFGQGDDHLLSCAEGHGAPDVAIGWTAPAAGTYRFDTFGSTFDTALAVLDGCAGAELACSEDAGARRTSELSVTLSGGQAVVVVIDGFNELASGAAVLNVTAL